MADIRLTSLTVSEHRFLIETLEEIKAYIHSGDDVQDLLDIVDSSIDILSNPVFYTEDIDIETD